MTEVKNQFLQQYNHAMYIRQINNNNNNTIVIKILNHLSRL